MQIVIDIDDETYNDIKKGKIYSSFRDVPLESVNAIANGTPLPENHGRIVDLDTVTVEEDTDKGVLWLDAPTILEAYYRK